MLAHTHTYKIFWVYKNTSVMLNFHILIEFVVIKVTEQTPLRYPLQNFVFLCYCFSENTEGIMILFILMMYFFALT